MNKSKLGILFSIVAISGVTATVFALNDNSFDFTTFDFIPSINSAEADTRKNSQTYHGCSSTLKQHC